MPIVNSLNFYSAVLEPLGLTNLGEGQYWGPNDDKMNAHEAVTYVEDPKEGYRAFSSYGLPSLRSTDTTSSS